VSMLLTVRFSSYMVFIHLLAGMLLGFALAYILLEVRYRALLQSTRKSFDVKKGKIVEQLAPYLQSFPYDPHDARFIGNPVDFVVFDGLNSGGDVSIVFVEVKSGKSSLNDNERRIREAIENRRVRFELFRSQ